MAEIYQKLITDKALILAPREGFMRPFNLSNWTEIRMGMYFTGVSSGSNDTFAGSDETVALSSKFDRFHFGIKSDTPDLPGTLGTDFIGMTNSTNAVAMASFTLFGSNGASINNTLVSGVSKDATFTLNGVDILRGMRFGTGVANATTYNSFYAIKIVINNPGLSTQTVTISTTNTQDIAGSSYDTDTLNTLINNGTYTTSDAVAWNNGVTAYALPTHAFIHLPFYNYSIRISALRVTQYA